MDAKLINTANDFLGASESRYFSNGYKYINYSYIQSFVNNGLLNGILNIGVNDDCPSVINHLGAIEYTAIACNLCEQLLKREYNLTNEEIAVSWIRSFYLKIKKPVQINESGQVGVSSQIMATHPSEISINGYISQFVIQIGDALVKLEVDHPVKLWFRLMSCESMKKNVCGLYMDGYKQRNHRLINVYPNMREKACKAFVGIIEKNKCDQGLGAGYRAVLLSDVINISGQLSQILLYTLEGISKKDANNMWLREFSMDYLKPYEKFHFPAKITFDRFEKVKIHNEDWRSVYLTSHLGDIQANFKITHKITIK